MESFQDVLRREAVDRVAKARTTTTRCRAREREVQAVLGLLARHRSVLLVGDSGVGKTTLVHAVASALAQTMASSTPSALPAATPTKSAPPPARDARDARDATSARTSITAGLWELSSTELFRGTRYLGEWQTKVTTVLQEARGGTLYVPDVANLLEQGRTVQSSTSVFDAMRPALDRGEVTLIGEVTPEVLERLRRTPSFMSVFEVIDVAPLGRDDVEALLVEVARDAGRTLDRTACDALLGVTSRFLPARPPPGPALSALEHLIAHSDARVLTHDAIERGFADAHGLPHVLVCRDEPLAVPELRAWFKDRVVGQSEAIEAVVEMIALLKAGLHDPRKPIGTFLFVGPTGVGKTETARSLASYLFGSEARMLRFDLSELKDYHAFEQLLGDPQRPSEPARLLDPVRAQPFQVVLFDELEKAHANVWDLLLPLLDEGRLSAPTGASVDFRSTIIVCTSNVGAQRATARGVGFGAKDGELEVGTLQRSLEEQFRPELLNRFQHIVPFRPLTPAQLRTVARLELGRVLGREGITGRGLVVEVDDEVLDLIVKEGVDPRFGARSLQRQLQKRLVLPMAMALVAQPVPHGTLVRVAVRQGEVVVRLLDTEESRVARRTEVPAVPEPLRVKTAAELSRKLAELERLELDEDRLEAERATLEAERSEPGFWRNPARAAVQQEKLEWIEHVFAERDALTREHDEVRESILVATTHAKLEHASKLVRAYEQRLLSARRELVTLASESARADALVEVRAVGRSAVLRDLLVRTYREWAEHRGYEVVFLRDPSDDEEPAMLLVRGRHAHGFLGAERGLHRLRIGESDDAKRGHPAHVGARVRVAPWLAPHDAEARVQARSMRTHGHFGSEPRLRAELSAVGLAAPLVLVTPLRSDELESWAGSLAYAWGHAALESDEVVRRYEREPDHVRDFLTGWSSGRADALAPPSFDRLLALRVDAGAHG